MTSSLSFKGKVDIFCFIYLSQCPPCKVFTPELVKSYNKIVGDSKPLEIIFISSDRSQDFFDEYFGSMPWLAVPYEDKRVKDLSKYFGVEGV